MFFFVVVLFFSFPFTITEELILDKLGLADFCQEVQEGIEVSQEAATFTTNSPNSRETNDSILMTLVSHQTPGPVSNSQGPNMYSCSGPGVSDYGSAQTSLSRALSLLQRKREPCAEQL